MFLYEYVEIFSGCEDRALCKAWCHKQAVKKFRKQYGDDILNHKDYMVRRIKFPKNGIYVQCDTK